MNKKYIHKDHRRAVFIQTEILHYWFFDQTQKRVYVVLDTIKCYKFSLNTSYYNLEEDNSFECPPLCSPSSPPPPTHILLGWQSAWPRYDGIPRAASDSSARGGTNGTYHRAFHEYRTHLPSEVPSNLNQQVSSLGRLPPCVPPTSVLPASSLPLSFYFLFRRKCLSLGFSSWGLTSLDDSKELEIANHLTHTESFLSKYLLNE